MIFNGVRITHDSHFRNLAYNNIDKAFNGISNINKAKARAGTYYYILEYSDNGVIKKKTGYFAVRW